MKRSQRQYEMEFKTNAVKLANELQKLQAENKEWKQKASQLELEKEILDKAARFFAQSQKK